MSNRTTATRKRTGTPIVTPSPLRAQASEQSAQSTATFGVAAAQTSQEPAVEEDAGSLHGQTLGHDFSQISVLAPLARRAANPPSEPPEEPTKKTADLTRQAEKDAAAAEDVTPVVQDGIQGGGQPLDRDARAFLEPRFGHDFSQVRVHTDTRASESAQAVQARAFAVGSDVVFGAGQYAPGTSEGKRLLAHELTHVVQQTGQVSRDLDPVVEAARVKKLNEEYDAKVQAGDMAKAAELLNAFNDTDILARLKKLSSIERRGMYFAAAKWVTRVTGPIAAMDPQVTEGAAVSDAQLAQIQKDDPAGVTVALYANYDYGDDKTRANNAAFKVESTRFAGNEGAVGLSGGGGIGIGTPVAVDEVSQVITVVQSIHKGLVDKWRSAQTAGGGPAPTADAAPPPFTLVRNLALFAHGEPYGIGMDKKNAFQLHTKHGLTESNVKAFVSGLTGVVTANVRVQLFSCNAALGTKDSPEWGEPAQGGRKGADSFAAALAEALGPDASVYGHTAAAHTTELTSARVFGHDAGGGAGGLHLFDLLYDETFVQSELARLFPDTPDRTPLHDPLRDEMWRHYNGSMYDYKDVPQADGTTRKQGVPKTYGPGEHALGQDQFADVGRAKDRLHKGWTDVWIKDPAHLARVKPKTPPATPVQRQVQRAPDQTVQRDPLNPDPNDTEPGWPAGKTAKNHHWDKLPAFQLAAEVSADLLTRPEFASKAPVVLNGYWIKDIFDVVRLIKDKHHALDALDTQSRSGWPRIAAVVALVKDPQHFDFDTYLAGLSAEDKKAFQEPDPDHPGQFRANAQVGEMKAFQAEAHARQWPALLRPATPAQALTPAQVKDLCKVIADNRANVPIRQDLHQSDPDGPGSTYHTGLYYTRSKADLKAGKEPSPTNTAEKNADGQSRQDPLNPEAPPSNIDPARTRVNKLAWQEVLTEGSAASVNTYDSQLLTVGRGFGVQGGQGRDVLQTVFASDPLARDLMLDVGFTVDGGKTLALDVSTGHVLEGSAALHLIELNKPIFSQFMHTFEDNPDHQQEMVNAQFTVLRQHAANIPEQVYKGGDYNGKHLTPWDDNVIRFGIHLNHFASGLDWPRMIRDGTDSSGKGDILKLARIIAPYCNPKEAHGSATVLTGEQTRLLEWGEGVLPGALPAVAPLPTDVDSQSAYFFLVGGNKYKRLNK